VQRDGVALGDGPLRLELQFDGLAIHPLEEAEVDEGDTAVGEQEEVTGMGIPGELAVAIEAAEEEAEDDLADPVALGLGTELQLLKADAGDEFADERWFWASSS
jgi:hypothetical protein